MTIVGLALAAGGGCVPNLFGWWLPTGIQATIEAEKKPLTDGEIAKLRELTKTIAEAQGLHFAEVPPYFYDTFEICDTYEQSPGPHGRGIALDVARDRKRAEITITDYSYPVERDVRSDVRNVMDRLRKRLADELPDRPVQIEEIKEGLWYSPP